GRTYTTAAIAFGSGAQALQDAIRAATSGSASLGSLGTITVSATGTDTYRVAFGGSLTGINIQPLSAAAVSVDPQLPSGTFKISVEDPAGDRFSTAVAYSSTPATLRSNLQTALDGLFGAGNVQVDIDAAETSGRNQAFLLKFRGSLAKVDVADITSHFDTLSLGRVAPYSVTQGVPRVGEVQAVRLTSPASELSYTLTFTHAGQSATTSAIQSAMTQADAQALINAAMTALSAKVALASGQTFSATATLKFWNGKSLELEFGGALLGIDVAPVTVAEIPKRYTPSVSVLETGYTQVTPAKPIRTLVVDYSVDSATTKRRTELDVRNGAQVADVFALTLDGARGELLQASAKLTLDVYGFVAINGNFSLDKGEDEVVLGDAQYDADGKLVKPASAVRVDALRIGASNVNAFVGVGGGYDSGGALKAGAIGVSLSGTEFGLAILNERLTGLEPAGTRSRSWTSFQAAAASASFVGVDGLTLSVDTLTVEVNRQAADGTLVDYKARGLEIQTGTRLEPSSLTLSMDASEGQLLRARGNLTLDIFGFVQAAGGFGIEKKTGQVSLADNPATADRDESVTPVNVDMLLIGGSELTAFAGVNGGQANAAGLTLSGVNLGLAFYTERLASGSTAVPRKWTTAQATVDTAAFAGVDGLTIRVDTLSVAINRMASDGTTVDYSLDPTKTDGARRTSVTVLTGPTSDLTLTLDGRRGDLLEVSGRLTLDVFGFLQVSGEFAIERARAPIDLVLADGSTVSARALKLGASDLRAFVGVAGGTANAIGFELAGVEFGLALYSHATDQTRSWTSLQASARSAALVGIDGLVVSGDTLSVEVNRAAKVGDSVVDYSLKDAANPAAGRRTAVSVRTGISSQVNLAMDGAQGRLLRASGNLTLDAFGFFQAAGGFGIESRDENFWLNDGVVSEDPTKAKAPTEIRGRMLTIGGTGIDAFAGVGGGTAGAMGLRLRDVDFGVALVTEIPATTGATAREFTTVKARAGSVGFVGLEGFEASATDLAVEINRGIKGTGGQADVVIDYGIQQIDVLAGPSKTVTLDADGSLGELTRAAGNLKLNVFGFAQLEGNFAFQKSSANVKLAPKAGTVETVAVDLLAVGGEDINAFVGINGGSDDQIGLALADVDFALALMTSK
ncbi:MAG: hypothetical protein ACKO8O_15560, partial [Betaproteobacteria bacterium]